jgi:hypothetical protein
MEKISFIVKKELSKYLEFNIEQIYEHPDIDYAYIYGGSIRDILVEDNINDIDILCLSRSAKKLSQILIKNGYELNEDITNRYNEHMYKDIKIIHQPLTYIKNGKIVQIIRPAIKMNNDSISLFFKILTNIDMSSSGLYYDGFRVKESCNDALFNVVKKEFISFKEASMFNTDRFLSRKYKLEEKGWKEISKYTHIHKNLPKEFLKNIERRYILEQTL